MQKKQIKPSARVVREWAAKCDPRLIAAIVKGELPDFADIREALELDMQHAPEGITAEEYALKYTHGTDKFSACALSDGGYSWRQGHCLDRWFSSLDQMLAHYADCYSLNGMATLDWVDDLDEDERRREAELEQESREWSQKQVEHTIPWNDLQRIPKASPEN